MTKITANNANVTRCFDDWRELMRLARRRGFYNETHRTFHTRTNGQLWKHRETTLQWMYGPNPQGHPYIIRASYPVAG